jgi:hypothetical protein
MIKRAVLGGLVGSVVVFLVSFLWHMVPALGEMGVKPLPGENAVLAALRASIHEPGFYIFPTPTMAADRSEVQKKADDAAFVARYRQGPTGVVVYKIGGEDFSFGRLLGLQFLLGLAAALVAAWMLAVTAGGTTFGSRVGLVLAAALFGGLVYDLPAWLWYGFPTDYTVGHIAGWLVSWGVAGLAMAAIVKRPLPAGTLSRGA